MKPKMASGIHAKTRIYEQNDAQSFQSAITKIAVREHNSKSKHTTKVSASQCNNATPQSEQPSLESASPIAGSSTKKRHSRLSDAARPSVPRRTSSISSKSKERRSSRSELIQLHRQSCLLFASLDGSVAQPRNSSIAEHSASLTNHDTSMASGSSSSSTASYIETPVSSPLLVSSVSEESPLGYTLARKRTSLPSISDYRESRTLSPRDSRISHRSSFLSSFPEPPVTTTPPPLTMNHLRNASTYRVFPIQQPRASPNHSPTTQTCPPIAVTNSYSSSPNLNQDIYAQDPTSATSISWTSPATRQAEYAKIDRAHSPRQKILRKVAPRWLCGSLGGERGRFYDEDDGKRSVRRFRMDRSQDAANEKEPEHEPGELKSDEKPSMEATLRARSSSTSNLIDEKKALERQSKKAKKSKGWARFACF